MASFAPFEPNPSIAVAVSGGSDSLALCRLADRWARHRGGKVLALTVDHGLRKGSRDEAKRVEAWMHGLGIAHRILCWTPSGTSQKSARLGRYALLEEVCGAEGILHLLVGHTADDQAETAAFRWTRRSGPDGIAGMAAERELDQIRLLRPLLSIGRDRLRATLRGWNQTWIDDPTNLNERYARPRLRRRLARRPAAASLWQQRASGEANRRRNRDRDLIEALARYVAVHQQGYVVADPALLRTEVGSSALGRIVRTVRGSDYMPSPRALEEACFALRSGVAGRTIGGCHIAAGVRLVVTRESVRISDRTSVSAGETVRWDRRFFVTAPCEGVIAPLGDATRDHRVERAPNAALRGLPSLWRDGALVAVPVTCSRGTIGRPGARKPLLVRFRPPQPLTSAAFGGILRVV
ncbi:MAG: tRNA lysidine(34) synthetase TilS [Pseudomonadota bacterium]